MSSFSQLVGWMGTNPWLSIVSFIIAILGVALAIIFYIKGKKVKLPYYAVRSINIVRDSGSWIDSLKIHYSGQLIENLTVTKIAFWNAGRDTIDSRDIASAEPLTVRVKEGYKILDAKILHEKNKANKFSITTSTDQSYVTPLFDYVDKDEGVVIQLIHTGKSGKDIEFDGKIKGGGKPTKKFVSQSEMSSFRPPIKGPSSYSKKILRYIVAALMFTLPVPFTAGLFFETIDKSDIVIAVVTFIMYWGFGIYIISLQRRIPKGFDMFEEDF
mgnify:CR=1 FL=1